MEWIRTSQFFVRLRIRKARRFSRWRVWKSRYAVSPVGSEISTPPLPEANGHDPVSLVKVQWQETVVIIFLADLLEQGEPGFRGYGARLLGVRTDVFCARPKTCNN